MPIGDTKAGPTPFKPPRAMAWVVLLAAAAAVLATGLVGTLVLLRGPTGTMAEVPGAFWLELMVAAALTVTSLVVRSLRWIFLLRRAETRIPIRDAYVGYFAGLSLLMTPFLLGEIALRAAILRTRGRVPVSTTIVVNLWERLLDLTALATIAGLGAAWLGQDAWWTWTLLAGAVATLSPGVRRALLRLATLLARPVGRSFDAGASSDTSRLGATSPWLVAFLTSLAAWLLPGIAFWRLANVWSTPFSLVEAEHAYAVSSSLGGLVLAPGGVLVTGGVLLNSLVAAGFSTSTAALAVFGARLATVGVATALGLVFLVIHFRTAPATTDVHFDELAEAYDVQIPESRREALLVRKTTLMRDALTAARSGRRGLDVGCGQGAYLGRMRELGFDVTGIDASAGQLAFATRKLGSPGLVSMGSVLAIPAETGTFDFVYIINVLHHLASVEEQRRAFEELLRVLKPGGLVFVHEINTRNVLFRFYMGYVFPSLNCIDEGVERWLRADRFRLYTDAPVVDVRYFTFLPEFVPRFIVRLCGPVERALERSRFGVYSAHYMAALRKPDDLAPRP